MLLLMLDFTHIRHKVVCPSLPSLGAHHFEAASCGFFFTTFHLHLRLQGLLLWLRLCLSLLAAYASLALIMLK